VSGPLDWLRYSITTRCTSYGLAQAWEWIFDNAVSYPEGLRLPPWKRPVKPDEPRKFVCYEVTYDAQTQSSCGSNIAIASFDGSSESVQEFTDDGAAALYLLSCLTRRQYRGYYHVFNGAARGFFHLLFRRLAHTIGDNGFTLSPFAAGPTIKAVSIRRGHRTVTLCDPEEMTGIDLAELIAYGSSIAPSLATRTLSVSRVWAALNVLQQLALREWRTSLRATTGATSLRIAAWHLPEGAWLWKPSSLLLTLCRAAGGYRAGYVYGTRYKGPAYQVDLSKAYGWGIAQPIPLRTAPGPAEWEGKSYEGLFVCEVFGPGKLPIYVAPFVSRSQGFRRRTWNARYAVCVLASCELDGIRRLGFTVNPHFGAQFLRTFDFGNLSRSVERMAHRYRRGSAPERFAKHVANNLYGKLAESPRRTNVIYATERPSGDWLPFLSEQGEEVENVYVSTRDVYRNHQQVGIASVITARVRNTLYCMLADTIDAGYRVVAADTDGFIATGLPANLRDNLGEAPGQWRILAYDENATVAGRRFYRMGSNVRVSGVPGPTPELVELVQRGETVIVAGKRMAVPWSKLDVDTAYQIRVSPRDTLAPEPLNAV
jgi:hypothetical protein